MDEKKTTRRVPGAQRQAVKEAYQLRIIGGRWRGRRLDFPAIQVIRPSPDRVRETLFNWLQPHIVGASCLDLFAGSGALGFEALSRGAAHVCFVDREVRIGRYLRDTLQGLECTQASVHVENAGRFLRRAPRPFDIVFLDPPFESAALPEVCGLLMQGWLAPQAWIYIECAEGTPLLPPPSWQMYRSRRAGQVSYHLLRTGLPRTGRISNSREVTS
ncbi:16S rRNA (guanine966-N2)-methyltransferase [Steroidobacter denitrificans]|uniref:Ribosomal RNA small subunit methyltransferase D n=1 Tax=Steroidobacter denitrificans TaxID=465721 RepID=A0A127FEA1_STEDE|nr:16S rRNA (guanine966-N2)-methyltransferase [Steroidobacter denitrificans]